MMDGLPVKTYWNDTPIIVYQQKCCKCGELLPFTASNKDAQSHCDFHLAEKNYKAGLAKRGLPTSEEKLIRAVEILIADASVETAAVLAAQDILKEVRG